MKQYVYYIILVGVLIAKAVSKNAILNTLNLEFTYVLIPFQKEY